MKNQALLHKFQEQMSMSTKSQMHHKKFMSS